MEIPSLRSETSTTYANPDGTRTLEQHAMPVRVRRGDGWVAPDTTLHRQPDGSIRPAATTVPIVLSGGGSTNLLSIGHPDAQVRMGWIAKLPAPEVSADTATYPDVFPGVDLRIQVTIDGFSHLLVVKDRAAAQNPALRTLHYPVSATGVTLRTKADGRTVAVDRAGKILFTAGNPMMWDTPPAPVSAAQKAAVAGLGGKQPPKYARVGLATTAAGQLAKAGTAPAAASPTEFVLTPDTGMLDDPAARFPLYIDPSLSGGLIRWMHVNVRMGNQTGWGYDTNDGGAKVGWAYDNSGNLYRSMFLLSTVNGAQTIAGATITDASFHIVLDYSPSGTATPVEAWLLQDLDPNAFLDWDNTGGYWKTWFSTQSAEAYPRPDPKNMTFAGDNLKNAVQDVANRRATTMSIGLKAPDERNIYQWKKFQPNTAVLSITYDNPPRMPRGLNMTRPVTCGTASAPVAIGTNTPQFTGAADDPDSGDNITSRLQIVDPSGNVAYQNDVGPTVAGSSFSWPQVPTGSLANGVVYHYHATSTDSSGITSPATPDCYFIVDTVKPSVPKIVSADYPDGEPTLYVRTTGTVTFQPGSTADNDIAEYVYGFQQDKVTMRVKAAADGTAKVPITVAPDPTTGVPSKKLYVRAVDRAGNVSAIRPSWDLEALDEDAGNPHPVRHVRADATGDGKADITAVIDQGFGRTTVWNVTSAANGGFVNGYIGWDSGDGGGFALYRTRPVQGDFDGDGHADIAMFREGAGRTISLYLLLSDGNRYNAFPAVWTSDANAFPLSTARVVAGDVDNDGKTDIIVQNAGTNNNWQALVFTAKTGFKTPTVWTTAAAGNSWAQSTPLIADIDGDHNADLVSVRSAGTCRTAIDVYPSTGSGFGSPTTIYDSGAGNYCWEKNKPVVADVNGDGKDDIVSLYEYGPSDTGYNVFLSNGSTLTQSSWLRRQGALDLSVMTLLAGDYDGDGKSDVALLNAGAPAGHQQVFTFHSTGTAFEDAVLAWDGEVDASTGPKFDLEHRNYELVNRNSGKCLNVQGVSTADMANFIQYQCLPLDLNARFRIDAVNGLGTYTIRPMHIANGSPAGVMCADVAYASVDDGAQLVQHPCGGGNGEAYANQQVTLQYVEGASYDTVVQLKFAHSGKCAGVDGARTDDLAPVKQVTCGQSADQQWILRATYNPTQLGENGTARYRVEADTNHNMVLDVTNCETPDNGGGQVRMWDWVTGSPCQGWQLESLGDDVYKIIDPDPRANRPIDVNSCSKLTHGTVETWPRSDSECQLWRIEPSAGGTFSVTMVSTGYSMDVSGCDPNHGALVITWLYWEGACQRWTFRQL
ncbi:RICIN domain-containing protein [Fodinicola acaciae]|uniref:RICIN domain-containing protein n=1 Tax=Fodinicola acaciae TaxID=2681555 RepID=UPI0013D22904|nr:RICIN domain-containing protein [Fodinicola acaciae]